METKADWRELMVQFTCSRCKAQRIEKYADVMKSETYGFLRNSELPEGWDTIGYSRVVCGECKAAYDRFINMED